MQTFLPFPSLYLSAICLDNKRLGKQRVECLQILNALERGPGAAWYNHPAVQMWKGCEEALQQYMNCCIREWTRRGFKNTMQTVRTSEYPTMPSWFGNPEFHASHRSNLLRKDPEFYAQYRWKESPELAYVWPKAA